MHIFQRAQPKYTWHEACPRETLSFWYNIDTPQLFCSYKAIPCSMLVLQFSTASVVTGSWELQRGASVADRKHAAQHPLPGDSPDAAAVLAVPAGDANTQAPQRYQWRWL